MISVHNWTKGSDRSIDGGIIENNWGNCRFENLASSALRGRNMSMWREERWTEEKPDLNDNEQNTRLYFASTPEDRSAYLNNQPRTCLNVTCMGEDEHLWSLHPELQQLFTSLRAYILAPVWKRPSSTEEVYLCGATVLESLHIIKCVNSALGMCEAENESESVCVHMWNIFTSQFDLMGLKVSNIKSHL